MKQLPILILLLLSGRSLAQSDLPVVPESASPPRSDYYVAATGSDATGDGSLSLPWVTVAHSLSRIDRSEAATLYLRGGSYAGWEDSEGRTGSLTIRSFPGETAVITSKVTIRSVDNETLMDTNLTLYALMFDGARSAMHLDGVQGITVDSCTFVGNGYGDPADIANEDFSSLSGRSSGYRWQDDLAIELGQYRNVTVTNTLFTGDGPAMPAGRTGGTHGDRRDYGGGYMLAVYHYNHLAYSPTSKLRTSTQDGLVFTGNTIELCNGGIIVAGDNMVVLDNEFRYLTGDAIGLSGSNDSDTLDPVGYSLIARNHIHHLGMMTESGGTHSNHVDCIQMRDWYSSYPLAFRNLLIAANHMHDSDSQTSYNETWNIYSNYVAWENNLLYSNAGGTFRHSGSMRINMCDGAYLARNNTICLTDGWNKGNLLFEARNAAVNGANAGSQGGIDNLSQIHYYGNLVHTIDADTEATRLHNAYYDWNHFHVQGSKSSRVDFGTRSSQANLEALFADFNALDFNLATGSDALDALTTAYAPLYDRTGRARSGDADAGSEELGGAIPSNHAPEMKSFLGLAAYDLNHHENVGTVGRIWAWDRDGDGVTYSISGGADRADFWIDATTGVLAFDTTPDYESPHDSDADNRYVVIVQASDGTDTGTQTLTVAVQDAVPDINSDGGDWHGFVHVAENTTAVTTVTCTGHEGKTVTYAIDGAQDAEFFSINALSGELAFVSAPDYENPRDGGTSSLDLDNIYEVQVTATDTDGGTARQHLSVTVTDVAE